MAVRNGEAFVGAAVASILAQSSVDFELLVVDDGSEDATFDIVAAIGDRRVRAIRNPESMGLTRSLNLALRQTRAPFVARQDADDVSHPERLARQLELLAADPAVALCGTWAGMRDAEGNALPPVRPPTGHDDIVARLPNANQFVHGTLVCRREALERLGGYRETFRYAQDYDLVLRASERFRLANVGEELYTLGFHVGTVTLQHAHEQAAYAELARVLWRQRRERGSDDLDEGMSVERLLATLAPQATRQHDAEAQYAWVRGDMAGYRRSLMRAIRRRPTSLRPYAHLVLSFGGRKGAARAAALIRRVWR